METDLDQILLVILSFFTLLALLLVVLDRLESTLDAPSTPMRKRVQQLWQAITRSGR